MSVAFLEASKLRTAIQEAKESDDTNVKLDKILEAIEALKQYVDEKTKSGPLG